MSYKEKHIEPSTVNEPMAMYITQAQVNPFYGLLGNHHKVTSSHDVLTLSRKGLPKNILLKFAQKISVTLQELANIMHISERTLQRYDEDAIVKAEYAEKAIELARLYARGEEVFGSLDKFKLWMKTPLYVFKGETPISLLDTSIGFDIVFKELGRIEHGIFA